MVRIPENIRKVKRPKNTVVTPPSKDGRYPVRIKEIDSDGKQKNGATIGYIYGEMFIPSGEITEHFVHHRSSRFSTSAMGFRELLENGFAYVDKTSLIAEILDSDPRSVHFFTRPTRFGKTLNLDMLDCFFNIETAGILDYFYGMKITDSPYYTEYRRYKGSFPVIRLNMGSIDASNADAVNRSLGNMVSDLFRRKRQRLSEFPEFDSYRFWFDRFIDGTASEQDISTSIMDLSSCIFSCYGKRAIILIDEYDSFIQTMGGDNSGRDSVLGILSRFMTSTLKHNDNLEYGVVTGVLRLSQTGMISGLNNTVIHDIFDERTGDCFGYTNDDLDDLLDRTIPEESDRVSVKAAIKKAYDGYVFGGREIYNPRSVNMYLSEGTFGHPPRAYWDQQRHNAFLDDMLNRAPRWILNEIAALMDTDGFKVRKEVDPSVSYWDLNDDDFEGTHLYSILVTTGYLRAEVVERGIRTYICDISLPNEEVRESYRDLIRRAEGIRAEYRTGPMPMIARKDSAGVTEYFNFYLARNSIRDSWSHDDCKKWMLNRLLDSGIEANAEAESGNGFCDILIPKKDRMPRVCIEITTSAEAGTDNLDLLVAEGFRKIRDRRYAGPGDIVMSVGWNRKYLKAEMIDHRDL
ncbi:MAG: hypothetical protein E7Z70_06400 [Thermoplasmata archaeon]|nr:hypothetical protein [Thermoplasmata archaeon]